MTYALFIEKRAQRSLSQIARQDRDRIAGAIRSLADEPGPHGVTKLSGRNAWRTRVGNYRVLHEIHDDRLLILVVDIGHRVSTSQGRASRTDNASRVTGRGALPLRTRPQSLPGSSRPRTRSAAEGKESQNSLCCLDFSAGATQ